MHRSQLAVCISRISQVFHGLSKINHENKKKFIQNLHCNDFYFEFEVRIYKVDRVLGTSWRTFLIAIHFHYICTMDHSTYVMKVNSDWKSSPTCTKNMVNFIFSHFKLEISIIVCGTIDIVNLTSKCYNDNAQLAHAKTQSTVESRVFITKIVPDRKMNQNKLSWDISKVFKVILKY